MPETRDSIHVKDKGGLQHYEFSDYKTAQIVQLEYAG
jgi:hypothetical protein